MFCGVFWFCFLGFVVVGLLVSWLGFFNMTLHSVIDISRRKASSTFSAGTVHLQQVDHALTVRRQCMQSNSNS